LTGRIRSAAFVLVAVAAMAGTVAAGAEEPRARVIGLGWNAAPGLLVGDSEASFVLEGGSPELRLFFNDGVALELQWDVVGMIRARTEMGRGLYLQRTYLHLLASPESSVTFSVAPYVLTGIGAADGATYGTVGAGARVGFDLFGTRPVHGGLGLYLRPGFVLTGVTGVRPAAGFAMMIEATWTFYFPPKR